MTTKQQVSGLVAFMALAIGGCHPALRTAAPPGLLRNVADTAGIHFVQGHGGRLPLTILDTIGSGCAFVDYDGDGWLDILLVGQPSCRLYCNKHDGTFEDVTDAAGLGASGHWLGCAVGDFTGDGVPDLYMSGYECGALYRNDHGHFYDVTVAMGIRPHGFETSCGFFDADGDGRLDLYVGRYVEFGPGSVQTCAAGDMVTACGPKSYPAEMGSLYINNGTKFADETLARGISTQSGKCLGVTFADFDDRGRSSMSLANDEVPANLFARSGTAFKDIALSSGVAFDTNGYPQGGMGTDWGDYDNDGRLDLAVGTYENQATSLYHNQGNGLFDETGSTSGLSGPGFPFVKFGLRFFDFDNDGWLDMIVANGHVQGGHNDASGVSYAQPLQLFHNQTTGKFSVVASAVAGAPFEARYVGRGLAIGDYDNDGSLDALVVDSEGSALLLHNESKSQGNWLEIDLRSKRPVEGAVVRLRTGELSLMRNVTTSGSYLSANPLRIHFGLGENKMATDVKIQWPGGKTQLIPTLEAGHIWRIGQGSAPVMEER